MGCQSIKNDVINFMLTIKNEVISYNQLKLKGSFEKTIDIIKKVYL